MPSQLEMDFLVPLKVPGRDSNLGPTGVLTTELRHTPKTYSTSLN